MDLPSLLAFAAIFAIAAASPGPAVAALVARVLGKGAGGAVFFCAGLMLGDLLWLTCAAFGIAMLAATFQPVFLAVKYAGVAYLLFVAWKLWHAPAEAVADARPIRGDGVRLAAAGLSIALGNPKTMLFYVALLPTLVDLSSLTALSFAELAGVITIVYGGVLAAYVLLAVRARRFFRSPRAMKLVNRTSGTIMAGAAVAVATR